MRRLFIIRKDLNLSAGKLAAMVAHCAEGYWTRLIAKNAEWDGHEHYAINFSMEPAEMDEYIKGLFVKTICEAKNLNHLMKVKEVADWLGLHQGIDYDFIDDACLTELQPEATDENGKPYCRVGVWFKPLPDDVSHVLSKKYQLYKEPLKRVYEKMEQTELYKNTVDGVSVDADIEVDN